MTKKQISQDYSVEVVNDLGTETVGINAEVVNATVYTLEDLPTAAFVIVSTSSLGSPKEATYISRNNSGTKSLVELATSSLITDTKDTANSLNVYYESNVFSIQNLLPASADATVNIKVIG